MEEWQNEIAAVFKDLTALFDGFRLELTELVEEFEEPAPFNWDIAAPTKPTPDPATHPACVGCIYYDGSTFGGNLLVCGMHPYGSNCDTCADWMGADNNDLN
jgi:hypothetical protein